MRLSLKKEFSPKDLGDSFRSFTETKVSLTGERVVPWASYNKDEFDFEKIKFIQFTPKTLQPYRIPGLEVLPEQHFQTRDFWVSRFLGDYGHWSLDSRAAEAIWENRQALIPRIREMLKSRPPMMSLNQKVLIVFPGDLLSTDASDNFKMITGIFIDEGPKIGWTSTYLDMWFYDFVDKPWLKVYFATV